MKKERSKKYRALQLLRIITQAVFFGLFLYLLFKTHFTGQDYIGRVEVFFHFDPLLAIATAIASRVLFASFILAGVTLVVTLVAGRYVCGWVCPLGSVHQFFSFVFKKAKLLKPRKEEKSAGRLAWKYYILLAVLVGSLFTVDLVGIADPLSFLYRSFATGIIPWFARAGAAFIGLLYGLKLSSAGDAAAQFFGTLSLNQTFQQGFFLSLLFLGAVLLNISKERFWCRYLCPAGALLGLFSRWNVGKVRVDMDKCIKCNLCTLHCQTQANPYPNEQWRSSECVYCYTCASICPTKAVYFPVKRTPEKIASVNLSRRRLIFTSALAVVAAPFFKITPAGKRAAAKLIRPPGALPEPKFLQKCVKCSECMKACPTNGLQPALDEAGPEGIWTPVLKPRIGYCEYYCSLCTQVCPTGAIKELTIEEKIKVKIGSAWINKDRCIPYALGLPCIVCEEHCPTSPKAIKFVMVEAKLPDGTVATQKAPVIDLDLCIGCGICETKCPVMDDPAIYCTSVGEDRSEKNRLLLELIQPATLTEEPKDPYK
ncbi:MAG TPA: (4Fe-4S)-binding protein [Candidatus Aminicenantes bacterium]|nr:(4Fe-4S)-binding protein [Candidatus Aminicenantes bacterium]